MSELSNERATDEDVSYSQLDEVEFDCIDIVCCSILALEHDVLISDDALNLSQRPKLYFYRTQNQKESVMAPHNPRTMTIPPRPLTIRGLLHPNQT